MEFGGEVFRLGFMSPAAAAVLLAILTIAWPLRRKLASWTGEASLTPKGKVSFAIVMTILAGVIAGGFIQPPMDRLLACGWTAQCFREALLPNTYVDPQSE